MNAISACLAMSFSLIVSSKTPLSSEQLSGNRGRQLNTDSGSKSGEHPTFVVLTPAYVATDYRQGWYFCRNGMLPKSEVKPSEVSNSRLFLSHLLGEPEEIDPDICRTVPIGIGIPGFPPGLSQSKVFLMFGMPTQTGAGYWPNTKAAIYDLIPGKVSLGFLFDNNSDRLRQTEVAFADSVATPVVLRTLNGMLGCRLTEAIKAGFEQVREGKTRRYFFSVDALEGVIERDERDRIYIGIWEAGLH